MAKLDLHGLTDCPSKAGEQSNELPVGKGPV